jgi:hypothetical protein
MVAYVIGKGGLAAANLPCGNYIGQKPDVAGIVAASTGLHGDRARATGSSVGRGGIAGVSLRPTRPILRKIENIAA